MGNMCDMHKQGMLPWTKNQNKQTKYLCLCMYKLPQLSIFCSFGKNVIVSQKTELILCCCFLLLKLTFVFVCT